jgi:L-threonylcarbamoyladenylate synthase
MAVLNPTRDVLEEAARHLRAGGLVAFPTETVYGLGGDATSARAIASIFDLKGRPKFNPLIIHVPSIAAAEKLVKMDVRARYLAKRLWPGALTMILPPQPDSPVQMLALGGQRKVAIRIPDHPLALDLLELVGRPLAAPSANRSGSTSPTWAEHVDINFGRSLAMILDGGPCRLGIESTIIDLTTDPATLLRPGAVTIETIAASIGQLAQPGDDASRSPGTQSSHYAPNRPLRIGVENPQPGEVLLAFGPYPPEGFAATLNLSDSGDLVEAAANLFSYLHSLDRPEFSGIATMPIPERGLGLAINDRLRRAAAPRS